MYETIEKIDVKNYIGGQEGLIHHLLKRKRKSKLRMFTKMVGT